MPILFSKKKFTPVIARAMRIIQEAITNESFNSDEAREIILDNLIPLEKELERYYIAQLQRPHSEAKVCAQRIYREFIQYLLYLACQNNKDEAWCQDLRTFAMCSNLFRIETNPGIYETVLWVEPNRGAHLLNIALKRGFPNLLPSLLHEAELALATAPADEHDGSLRHFFRLFDFKAMLFAQMEINMACHWNTHEHRLTEQWQNLIRQYPESQYHRFSEKLISSSEKIVLFPGEVDGLIERMEQLQLAIIELINAHADPVTFESLMDKENEAGDRGEILDLGNLADPMCFLPDGYSYFRSTFQELYNSSREPGLLQSPVTKEIIDARAYESESLLALVRLSRGILAVKERILIENRISVKEAIGLMFGDNIFRSRKYRWDTATNQEHRSYPEHHPRQERVRSREHHYPTATRVPAHEETFSHAEASPPQRRVRLHQPEEVSIHHSSRTRQYRVFPHPHEVNPAPVTYGAMRADRVTELPHPDVVQYDRSSSLQVQHRRVTRPLESDLHHARSEHHSFFNPHRPSRESHHHSDHRGMMTDEVFHRSSPQVFPNTARDPVALSNREEYPGRQSQGRAQRMPVEPSAPPLSEHDETGQMPYNRHRFLMRPNAPSFSEVEDEPFSLGGTPV
ncbi:hypothetical protein [Legionella nagasakiensis]|uniref:hypothetical protein n=1 Tax=Legionella nagasakiensis TaxID=535290 RepID=UPI001054B97F|nr:hypothetical protein [Legionella nagasakiensis]